MESTTEQRLETCIHSGTCPPIQLITNNSPIPSLLDIYLHYTKPLRCLQIKHLIKNISQQILYRVRSSMTIVLCWNKKNKVNHVKILKKYSKGDQYQKKSLIRNISRQIFNEEYHPIPTFCDCYPCFTKIFAKNS